MREYVFYDTAVLQRAVELRYSADFSWQEIIDYLCIPEKKLTSFRRTVYQHKNGKRSDRNEKRAEARTYLEKAVDKGLTTLQMAKKLKISRRAAAQRLQRMGLDHEMREEIRSNKK